MAQALLPAGSTLVSSLLPGSAQNAEMSLGAADTSARATSGTAKVFLRARLVSSIGESEYSSLRIGRAG